jgi:MFS family permease
VADRFGHRHVLKAAAGFSFLAVLSILGIPSLYGAYGAFALISLSLIGYNISFSMHIIQHSPQDRIPLFVSINAMITLLLSSAGTLLSGLIIDKFSFIPIFIFSGIAAAADFLFLHKAFRSSGYFYGRDAASAHQDAEGQKI